MTTKVLMAHHVASEPVQSLGPDVDYWITPDSLRACLKEHGGWRATDYASALREPEGEARLVVTFDDGYRNTMTEALPVLEELSTPCVVFVVTGFLDGLDRPLESDLAWLLSRCHEPADAAERYRLERKRLRKLPHQRQRAALERLRTDAGVDAWPDLTGTHLTWDEVVELDEHPLVTIGAHSVHHWRLERRMSFVAAFRESRRSKRRLEARLGREVECYAYPYGRNTPWIRRATAAAGFRFAFTTTPGLVRSRVDLDPMGVPRFDVNAPGGWGPCDPSEPALQAAGPSPSGSTDDSPTGA